jgi:hypothetical protein
MCASIEELLPEVALEIASGEDRAVVLRHVVSCARCRELLEDMSSLSDDLLLIGPVAEPPSGFESRVTEAIVGPGSRARRRRYALRGVAVVAAALVGAGSIFFVTRSDRRLADYTRHQLAVENGEYFEAAQLRTGQGVQAGQVFAYQGSPSWIVVIVAAPKEESYAAEIRTKDGRWISLGSHRFTEGGTWGQSLPLPFDEVSGFRLTDGDGAAPLEAEFTAHDPM